MTDFNGALTAGRVPPGSVIVAGKNFGCGSSREQAVSALKGHELVIVAQSYARIFLQNAINLGLRIVTAPGLEAAEGDEVSVRGETVVNETSGASSPVVKLPQARQAIIDAGGLIPYTRKRLLQVKSGDSHN
jgi:3-isopropylmalate dehydratase small subunit